MWTKWTHLTILQASVVVQYSPVAETSFLPVPCHWRYFRLDQIQDDSAAILPIDLPTPKTLKPKMKWIGWSVAEICQVHEMAAILNFENAKGGKSIHLTDFWTTCYRLLKNAENWLLPEIARFGSSATGLVGLYRIVAPAANPESGQFSESNLVRLCPKSGSGQISIRIWQIPVQLQVITDKTNAADVSSGKFAVLISATRTKSTKFIAIPQISSQTGKQWCNKRSTELYCIFIHCVPKKESHQTLGSNFVKS